MPDIQEQPYRRIVKDPETEKLVADYFQNVVRLNPQRLAIQAGWYDGDHYIVHIRFNDFAIPASFGSMPIYYTCEHMLDVPLTSFKLQKAIGRPMQRGDLAFWLLGDPANLSRGIFEQHGALRDTLELAWSEWVLNRRRRWPDGFPLPASQREAGTRH